MRGTLICMIALFCVSPAWAQLFKVSDLHVKSEALLKEAKATASSEERAKKLGQLKALIESARTEYDKKFPAGGNPDKFEISMFFHNLDPVFKQVEGKKDKAACDRTEGKITSADAQGRPEGAPLTKNAAIALEWLQLFCK